LASSATLVERVPNEKKVVPGGGRDKTQDKVTKELIRGYTNACARLVPAGACGAARHPPSVRASLTEGGDHLLDRSGDLLGPELVALSGPGEIRGVKGRGLENEG
jgi:hypothetical protein